MVIFHSYASLPEGTIWLWQTVCHGKSPFLIGEASTNGRAIPWQAVSHNQRVIHPRVFMAKFAIQMTWKSHDPECKKKTLGLSKFIRTWCSAIIGWAAQGEIRWLWWWEYSPNLWPVWKLGKSQLTEQCKSIWGEPIFSQSHRWCELCVVAVRTSLSIGHP